MDERPEGVNEANWAAFTAIWNAIPANRRTLDIPTTDEEARRGMTRMAAWIPRPPANTAQEKPKCFATTEAPEWLKLDDFVTYWPRLRFFMRGQNVTNNMCVEACFRILSQWKGAELQRYAQETDATDLARPTWAETRDNVLDWLNQKFRTKTDLSDAKSRWVSVPHRMQRKHFNDAISFYLAFETELNDYRAACIRNSASEPRAAEITLMFSNSLPSSIAARVRETEDDLDTAAYDTYRSKIARIWESHKESRIRINAVVSTEVGPSVKRAFEEMSQDWEGAEAAPVQKRPFRPYGQTRKGQCRETWEKAPRELQGVIYIQPWATAAERQEIRRRHQRVKEAGVCARCRLPKSKGHMVDTFVPVGPLMETEVRISEAEEIQAQLEENEPQED